METQSPHVYTAIVSVMADMAKEGVAKTSKNTQQGYAFRGIDSIYNALAPKLALHGLCILPRVVAKEVAERESKNGGNLFYTRLTVEFDLVSAKDGSKHTICTVGEAMDSADKSSNKAMSAAYKYAAFMAFCIPTEGDNDADSTTHEVVASFKPQPPRQQAPRPAQAPPAQSADRRDLMDRAMTLYGVMKEQGLKYKGKMFKDMDLDELNQAIVVMNRQLDEVTVLAGSEDFPE